MGEMVNYELPSRSSPDCLNDCAWQHELKAPQQICLFLGNKQIEIITKAVCARMHRQE
jgi:hypothetical protein